MLADAHIYLGVALAGLVSFQSPCVLPLVPPYLGYIGGTSLEQMTDEKGIDDEVWRRVVLAAVAIRPFLGFMKRFRRHLGKVEKVMGVVLVLTGILFLTGSLNWFGQWLIETFPGLMRIEDMIGADKLQTEIMKKGAGQ